MDDRNFKAFIAVIGCLGIALACMTFIVVRHSLKDSDEFRDKCHALGGKVQSHSSLCIKGDTVVLRGQ